MNVLSICFLRLNLIHVLPPVMLILTILMVSQLSFMKNKFLLIIAIQNIWVLFQSLVDFFPGYYGNTEVVVDVLVVRHPPHWQALFPDFAAESSRRHRHLPEAELPPLPGPEEGALQARSLLQRFPSAALRESNLQPPRGRHHRECPGQKFNSCSSLFG